MKIANDKPRVEIWLQVLSRKDMWIDCGMFITQEKVFDEMAMMRKNDPKTKWRCVERTISERVIERPA